MFRTPTLAKNWDHWAQEVILFQTGKAEGPNTTNDEKVQTADPLPCSGDGHGRDTGQGMTQFQAARELGIDVPMIRDVLARNLIQSDTREPRWSKSEVSLEPSGEYVSLEPSGEYHARKV